MKNIQEYVKYGTRKELEVLSFFSALDESLIFTLSSIKFSGFDIVVNKKDKSLKPIKIEVEVATTKSFSGYQWEKYSIFEWSKYGLTIPIRKYNRKDFDIYFKCNESLTKFYSYTKEFMLENAQPMEYDNFSTHVKKNNSQFFTIPLKESLEFINKGDERIAVENNNQLYRLINRVVNLGGKV